MLPVARHSPHPRPLHGSRILPQPLLSVCCTPQLPVLEFYRSPCSQCAGPFNSAEEVPPSRSLQRFCTNLLAKFAMILRSLQHTCVPTTWKILFSSGSGKTRLLGTVLCWVLFFCVKHKISRPRQVDCNSLFQSCCCPSRLQKLHL